MLRAKLGDDFKCRSHKDLFDKEHIFVKDETIMVKYMGRKGEREKRNARYHCLECAKILNLL